MPDEVVAGAVSGEAGTATTPEATTAEQNPAPSSTGETIAASDQVAQEQTTKDEPVESGLVGDEEPKEENAESDTPAEYSFDGLKVPEGQSVDTEIASALGKISREFGLDQGKFERLFNEMAPVLERRQAENLNEVRKNFIAQGKADKEIGGAKWNETKSLARKALYQFTDAETRDLLQASGLDCHPGIIRAFRNIALAISPDNVVKGSPVGKRDAAKAFFYNSTMN